MSNGKLPERALPLIKIVSPKRTCCFPPRWSGLKEHTSASIRTRIRTLSRSDRTQLNRSERRPRTASRESRFAGLLELVLGPEAPQVVHEVGLQRHAGGFRRLPLARVMGSGSGSPGSFLAARRETHPKERATGTPRKGQTQLEVGVLEVWVLVYHQHELAWEFV